MEEERTLDGENLPLNEGAAACVNAAIDKLNALGLDDRAAVYSLLYDLGQLFYGNGEIQGFACAMVRGPGDEGFDLIAGDIARLQPELIESEQWKDSVRSKSPEMDEFGSGMIEGFMIANQFEKDDPKYVFLKQICDMTELLKKKGLPTR